MIDSAFYGMIFSESYGQIATYFNGGYSSFLQGKVVDMFPLFNSYLPQWLPFIGGIILYSLGQYLILQAAISVGVINILIFHRSFFK